MTRIILTRLIVVLSLALSISACKKTNTAKAPDDKEIYNFFLDQLKQTAKASGYLKYSLTVDKLQQDTTAGSCTLPDRSRVHCFAITINRTENLDNYTGTYTSVYIGDTYHLYRDEQGKLLMIDHVAGSTSTVQKHHPDMSNTL